MVRFLLLLILFLFLARAVWRLVEGIVQGAIEGDRAGARKRREVEPGVKLVRDPVCGTYVVPERALTITRRGQTQYFCSDTCRAAYRERL